MTKFYTHFHKWGNNIYIRGYEDGRRFNEKVDSHTWQPYVYFPVKTESPYKTLDGVNVKPFHFDDIKSAREKLSQWDQIANQSYYGSTNWAYVYANEQYPEDIQYDVDVIKTAVIDIETMSEEGFPKIDEADQAIICVTIRCNGKSYVFAHQDYTPQRDDVTFIRCKDEVDMLYRFLDLWRDLDVDVITGWNIEFFDMPYIINRIKRLIGDKAAARMSPCGQIQQRDVRGFDTKIYVINGIAILDYLQMYRKFAYKSPENYKLDTICSEELGAKKLDYSEFDSLHLLYKHDFQKFVDYNVVDVDLVEQLDDKLKMIEQVLAIAYDGKSNYTDAFTTVRMWDTIIHNYLSKDNIVVPGRNDTNKDRRIEGAYVKDPQVGLHNWVVSFDLNSLYPHLIMQYNISPEMFAGKYHDFPDVSQVARGEMVINDTEYAVTGKGTYFRKDKKGFLPELMQSMYNDRVKFKNKMIEAKQQNEKTPSRELEKAIAQNHNMQMAKKIQLNSAYGALSNEYFRFFSNDLAESITLAGQLSIRWAERKINEYLNKLLGTDNEDFVIAVDTDSLYITMDKLVQNVFPDGGDTEQIINWLDKVSEQKLEPFLSKSYDELAEYTNAYEQKMVMAREVLADKGIWVAKKRYILHVHDNEGVRYAEPQLKMMGIEAIRSSTPVSCKASIKEALNIIMTQDNDVLNEFVRKFKTDFKSLPFEEIGFPRSVNKLDHYTDKVQFFRKGTPIHVKGAIMYNQYLKEQGKHKQYMTVKDGDKGKFIYMKLPNPLRVHVMTTPGTLPRDLGVEKYIDYDKQFDKAFIEPLVGIVEKIGWNIQANGTQLTFEDLINGN